MGAGEGSGEDGVIEDKPCPHGRYPGQVCVECPEGVIEPSKYPDKVSTYPNRVEDELAYKSNPEIDAPEYTYETHRAKDPATILDQHRTGWKRHIDLSDPSQEERVVLHHITIAEILKANIAKEKETEKRLKELELFRSRTEERMREMSPILRGFSYVGERLQAFLDMPGLSDKEEQ